MKTGVPVFLTESLVERGFQGMTLRDYFAAAAIPLCPFRWRPISSRLPMSEQDNLDRIKWLVSDAYEIADAMLAERSKP
jgi:hypothetical protein